MSTMPPPISPSPSPSFGSPSPSGFADFLSFKTMITPLIIKILFIVGVIVVVILGLLAAAGGIAAKSPMLVLGGLMYVVVGPLLVRIYCELLILFFRMYETLLDIKRNTTR